MGETLLALVEAGCALALSVVAFRAFPVVVSFFVWPASTIARVVVFLVYTSVACLAVAYSNFKPSELLLAGALLLCGSLLPYATSTATSWFAAFWWIFGLLFVVPALLFHEHSLLLVLGWEASFAAHSYCRHVPRKSRTLADYWFFVFVNPAPVYPLRGKRVAEPALQVRGLMRASAGAALLGASSMLTALAARSRTSTDFGVQAWAISLRFGALCCAYFGLASLQIGLCRQLGYVAPERFVSPYKARSPRDFWARWNTYYGGWVRLYVFRPITRALKRRLGAGGGRQRFAINGAALMASFFVIGALHDAFVIGITGKPNFAMTIWFMLNAAVILMWDAALLVAPKLNPAISRLLGSAAMLAIVMTLAFMLPSGRQVRW